MHVEWEVRARVVGASQGRRRLRPPAVPSLRGVLPAFQLKENVSSLPWLADSRAQVVATLACAIVPFRFEELVCVSCQGLCYESDAKQRCFAEARERTQRDGFLDVDFRGRAPDAARKVGRCVKAPPCRARSSHGWCAWRSALTGRSAPRGRTPT